MFGRGHRGRRPRGDGSRGPRTSSCSGQPHGDVHSVLASLLGGSTANHWSPRRLVFSILPLGMALVLMMLGVLPWSTRMCFLVFMSLAIVHDLSVAVMHFIHHFTFKFCRYVVPLLSIWRILFFHFIPFCMAAPMPTPTPTPTPTPMPPQPTPTPARTPTPTSIPTLPQLHADQDSSMWLIISTVPTRSGPRPQVGQRNLCSTPPSCVTSTLQ
jgi:hypothetical protein